MPATRTRSLLVSLILAAALAFLASLSGDHGDASAQISPCGGTFPGGSFPCPTGTSAPQPTAVPQPAATQAPPPSEGGGGGGGGGTTSGPAPTQAPASTPVPPANTPAPTSPPSLPTLAPQGGTTPVAATLVPLGAASPTAISEAQTPVAILPEPTLAPTIVPIILTAAPTGMPTVTTGGVIAVIPAGAVLSATPGVGIVRTSFEDRQIEVRVPQEGTDQSLAVRLQPMAVPPPDVKLPDDNTIARVFSLDVYKFNTQTNQAEPRTQEEKNQSSAIVIKWPVTTDEFNSTVDQNGNAHPQRLTFYQVHEEVQPNGEVKRRVIKVQTTWEGPPPGTLTAVFKDTSVFVLAVVPLDQVSSRAPADARYFAPTGFRIEREAFWDYFVKRGGVNTFGYPVSREFTLGGFPVQFFQRAILQAMPDGGVARMNLLDEGLMPYTQINFSTFPRAEQALIDSAPAPSDSAYGERALAFLSANVPDEWNGLPVNFLKTFSGTVRFEDAFPSGEGESALLPLINLELWGLPTSKPAYDPSNGGFVYQRFQRGIMHFDAATGATQGLLLADYLKSIVTGRNLPPDLAEQAKDSKFFRQYDLSKPGRLARPAELPGSDLSGAFESDVPREVVASSVSVAPLLLAVPVLAILSLLLRPRARGRGQSASRKARDHRQ